MRSDRHDNQNTKEVNNLTFDFDYYDDEKVVREQKKTQRALKKNTRTLNKLNRQSKVINFILGLVISVVLMIVIVVGLLAGGEALRDNGFYDNVNNNTSEGQNGTGNIITANEQALFEQVKDMAEQSGNMVKAALSDVGYLNQLGTYNVGGFTYCAETDYDLVQAYNNSRKMFITNYNNSNIKVNRSVVSKVSADGSYIQLGALDSDDTVQLVVKMLDSNMCNYARTFNIGDLVEVEGALDVDKNSLVIECDTMYKLKAGDLVTYTTDKLLKSLFENGETSLINNKTVELYGKLEDLSVLDNGMKCVELQAEGYNNVRIFAVVSEESMPTYTGLSSASSVSGIELRVTGILNLCDIDESTDQMFYIFINNSDVDIP